MLVYLMLEPTKKVAKQEPKQSKNISDFLLWQNVAEKLQQLRDMLASQFFSAASCCQHCLDQRGTEASFF